MSSELPEPQSTSEQIIGEQQPSAAITELSVDSFDELLRHENEIVDRINRLPNGGNLFMIHPLMLLADVGVVLSEQAKAEIMRHEPRLLGLSPVPYQALKNSNAKQNVRFVVRGLFERRQQ